VIRNRIALMQCGRLACALIVAVPVWACRVDKPVVQGSEVAYNVRDSSGVRIVESSVEALQGKLPWVVGEAPEFELGGSEGSVGAPFHRIAGIAALGEGGFAVVNGGSSEIRWFSGSGDYLRSFGSSGAGPGEFRDPLLVPQFKADSLLIFDKSRRTFTRVAADGSGARAIPRDIRGFGGTPQAAFGEHALFSSAGEMLCPENQGCNVRHFLRSIDLNGPKGDTLAVRTTRWLIWQKSGMGTFLGSPLNPRSMATAGPQGLVLEGFPAFELRQFNAEGRLAGIFRVQAEREPPEIAVEKYVNSLSDPELGREMFGLLGLPDSVPPFQAVLVDEEGWYWAELFASEQNGGGTWLVFDPQGRAQGLVELPPGLEVHAVGEDFILGTWKDELGVEYVRRYSLDRDIS